VKLVKNYSAKTIQRSCFGFEFGANVPDSRTYLDDNVYYASLNYYANSAKDVKADAVAQKADAAFEKF
jgi:hypothetical protein